MTQITKEYIEQEIASIKKQRTNAVNVVLQADGALLIAQDMLLRLLAPDTTSPAVEAAVQAADLSGAVTSESNVASTPVEIPSEERQIDTPNENPDSTETIDGGENIPGVVTE